MQQNTETYQIKHLIRQYQGATIIIIIISIIISSIIIVAKPSVFIFSLFGQRASELMVRCPLSVHSFTRITTPLTILVRI